jgi:lipopolysaccharide transport system permease protein
MALAPWRENRPTARFFPRLGLRDLWAQREVALALAERDVRLRYKQTAFGIAWVVLQPLLGMAVFAVVFGRLAGLPSDSLPYPAFVFAGLSVWLYVSGSVASAAESLAEHRTLVSKVAFPRALAPIAAALAGLVDLAISLLLVGAVMAVAGVAPTAAVLLVPLWILAAVLVAVGAGLWLSALNVLYRDVRYALGFALQLWLFASPVVFPTSLVGGEWRPLFALNPMVGTIEGFRWSLLGGPPPGLWALASLAGGVVLLVTGILYFVHVQRYFAGRRRDPRGRDSAGRSFRRSRRPSPRRRLRGPPGGQPVGVTR